ncbi:hypothetical protein [Micrococcoides hystricis]|uniref:Uncharacterized protein n=1 Tax=Micrococcoides hystricis TaxID=1572761 RepID=A0ABV6PA47_9MICC
MAGRAGSDQIARLTVERTPDEDLRIDVAFIKDDGTAVEFSKKPGDKVPNSLGSPTPRVAMSGAPVDEFDLEGIERQLEEVPDCTTPRAEIMVFGEHTGTNFRCGHDGPPNGQLDGHEVTKIRSGDFAAATAQLRKDLALLDTTHISSATIGMTRAEVWTSLHSTRPELADSNGGTCSLLMIRSSGGFVTRCESAQAQHTIDALDPDVMSKIWQAEGKPTQGWLLELVVEEDGPYWRATADHQSRRYDLAGDQK